MLTLDIFRGKKPQQSKRGSLPSNEKCGLNFKFFIHSLSSQRAWRGGGSSFEPQQAGQTGQCWYTRRYRFRPRALRFRGCDTEDLEHQERAMIITIGTIPEKKQRTRWGPTGINSLDYSARVKISVVDCTGAFQTQQWLLHTALLHCNSSRPATALPKIPDYLDRKGLFRDAAVRELLARLFPSTVAENQMEVVDN